MSLPLADRRRAGCAFLVIVPFLVLVAYSMSWEPPWDLTPFAFLIVAVATAIALARRAPRDGT